MKKKKRIILLSGRASQYLAEEIAQKLKSAGAELINVTVTVFSDGEIKPQISESIRGEDVFVIQSTHQPLDNLFELILLGDAAKRASALSVTAVIPYFGYSRQERMDRPRVPISAKVVASMIQNEGSFNRVITMDLHANQIQGFFDIPADNIYASAIFVPYILSLKLKNIMIASPDTGGTSRARKYADFLETEMVICYKNRVNPNQVKDMKLIGSVRGKNVIMVDDIVDTGGTLAKAANLMIKKGAKSVRVIVTHAVLSGAACKTIEESGITELLVTNTIPLKSTCNSKKIIVLSAADLLSNVIYKISNKESISSLFDIPN